MRVGGQSEVGRLLSVAVKPADDAFRSAATIDVQWRHLGYTAAPELGAASPEYRKFLALLESAGAEVLCLPPDDSVVSTRSMPATRRSCATPASYSATWASGSVAPSPPLRRRRCARRACRFAAASPATAASRAETSAGSIGARWRWAGATAPTMRESASCGIWWRSAWTR